MISLRARRSGGADACEPRAPETPAYDNEGVSAMQRAFFEIAPREPTANAAAKEASAAAPVKAAGMHRCASAPAIRESISAWHLSMVINAIASPKVQSSGAAPPRPAPLARHRHSMADLSVYTQ